MKHPETLHPDTRPIHAGPVPDPQFGAVSVPIYQSSTFAFVDAREGAARFAGSDPGYTYTRLGNPTVRALEEAVSGLEGGVSALGTATGMAAISTVMLALLKSGDHVICTDAVYGSTRLLLEKHLARFGIASSFVATESLDLVRQAVRPETRMIFIETPANPTMKITDILGCSQIAQEFGGLLVVDNTFCSPMIQQPFRFGADIVVHSMTKYLNGHSDVVAGIVISADESLHEKMKRALQTLGGTMDPHQAWLVLRGLRTLALRVERAQDNAMRLAEWLERHPKVRWVRYPGLASHPQYDLVRKQMKGPGSMISFGVEGGIEAGRILIDSVRLATRAVSLGSVETLIEHPASMTHAALPVHEREEAGITDDLVRISVGCENWIDLRQDLAEALEEVAVLVPAL